MPEQTMIERVARYLCASLSNLGPDDPIPVRQGFQVYVAADPPADGTMPAWRGWMRIASELLAAMREPTEAMVSAGNKSKPYNVTGYCEGKIHPVVQRAWPAMIDAALEDGR